MLLLEYTIPIDKVQKTNKEVLAMADIGST
jgi:hypothetical protein